MVGEAPGRQEDLDGEPFVGPSGQLLFELFDDVGLSRDVAVVNTVSCYPSGTPTWGHISACEANKWAQLELADPTFVLLAGRVALKGMRPDLDVKRGRGRPFLHRGRVCYATYHPAAALRNPSFADSMRDDLARFARLVAAGVDRWLSFVVDACAACPLEAEWYEPTGIAWCPVHLPGPEADAYRARCQLLAEDRGRAHARRHG